MPKVAETETRQEMVQRQRAEVADLRAKHEAERIAADPEYAARVAEQQQRSAEREARRAERAAERAAERTASKEAAEARRAERAAAK